MLLTLHISDVDFPQRLPGMAADLSSFSQKHLKQLLSAIGTLHERQRVSVEKLNIWNALQDYLWVHLYLKVMLCSCLEPWNTWGLSHTWVTGHRVRKFRSSEGFLSQHIVIDALWPALAWCLTRRSGYNVYKYRYVSKTTADWVLLWNKEVLFSHSEQHLWHFGSQNKAFMLAFLLCLVFVLYIFVRHFYVEHAFLPFFCFFVRLCWISLLWFFQLNSSTVENGNEYNKGKGNKPM